MYRNDKVNVPILGLVENMAWFTPAELPENKYFIFGKDGCKNLAKEMDAPLLAQIPLVQSICESGDAGKPAACDINTITGQAFISLAQAVVTVTNKRNREQAATKTAEGKKQRPCIWYANNHVYDCWRTRICSMRSAVRPSHLSGNVA